MNVLLISVTIFLSGPESASQSPENIQLTDYSRDRVIPIALYFPDTTSSSFNGEVIVFSHGYGGNEGTPYLNYSYLAHSCTSMGYLVVSIQHELPADPLLAMHGNFSKTRRPNWMKGVTNIWFVRDLLHDLYPSFNFDKVIVAGHSNGADMSALFGEIHPSAVSKLILLDNRRMSTPINKDMPVLTLRSNLKPDRGVIPKKKEMAHMPFTVIFLENAGHNDMDDSGSANQHAEIMSHIKAFLEVR